MKKITITELEKSYPKVYKFLKSNDMNSLEEKRYELDDSDYVNVESYSTYDFNVRKYESHIKFIDIQFIIVGRENIIVEPVSSLRVVEEYDELRDIAFYDNDVQGSNFILEEGEMLELLPEDGHMPCISVDGSIKVKKAVFKMRIK